MFYEVYFNLLGHLAFGGRRADGTLLFRSPLANLDGVRVVPGLVAVSAVLLGSTAFDSFAATNAWLGFTESTEANMTLINTGLLLAFCGSSRSPSVRPRWRPVFGTGSTGATAGPVRPFGGADHRRLHGRSLSDDAGGDWSADDGPALGPDGQRRGPGGTADWAVAYVLSPNPTLVALIKVAAVVTGHLFGVVAARPGRSTAAGPTPDQRPVRTAVGDDRLHRRRTAPAVQQMTGDDGGQARGARSW